jgi:hypothetical protein
VPRRYRARRGINAGHAGDTSGVLLLVKLGTWSAAQMVVDAVPEQGQLCRVRANEWGAQWVGGVCREIRGDLYVIERF